MLALPQHKLTVDEYLAWAEDKPGRFELYAGIVYPIAPDHVGHAKTKFAVQVALLAGLRRAGLRSHVLPDGMTIHVGEETAHVPDALVYCGAKLSNSAVEVPNPLILVEVLSRSICHIDTSAKLPGYFSLLSVRHYLIVDPDKPLVIHHARREQDIATRIVSSGPIKLDPPGIEVTVEDFYPSS